MSELIVRIGRARVVAATLRTHMTMLVARENTLADETPGRVAHDAEKPAPVAASVARAGSAPTPAADLRVFQPQMGILPHLGDAPLRDIADNRHMKTLQRAILTASAVVGLAVSPALASQVLAAPAGQEVAIEVTEPRVQLYPLGAARVQTVLSNPSDQAQTFAVEILMVRADGTVVAAYLSDPLKMASGAEAPATYVVRHAEGAVSAIVTPRPWPELAP
jgi:hypothetical protein